VLGFEFSERGMQEDKAGAASYPPLSSDKMRSPTPVAPLKMEMPKGVATCRFEPEMCGNKSADEVTMDSVEKAYQRLQRYNITH